MIGNVALDVVIGLVFVYLLYSLYATIIMEIISSSFGLRARNLCYALKRMLMDEKEYNSSFLQKFSRLITSFGQTFGKSTNLTNETLYESFFSQPSIKYLSSGGLSNKPSYLSAENFSKGIIDSLRNEDPDISLLAGIEQGIMNLPEKEPGNSETKRHLQLLLDDANHDLVKFQILLEQWYNDTMDRSTGWFKRSTQMFLLLIGFGLAIAFNVDTLSIIKRLSTDTDARSKLVEMATNFSEKNAPLINAIKAGDSTQNNQAIKIKLDSLNDIKSLLEEDIKKSQNVLASDWNISDSLYCYADTITAQIIPKDYKQARVGKFNVAVHRSIDLKILKRILPKDIQEGVVKISPLRYKFSYVFSYDHFLGYLMTALALSLGAPFWFDLLNKLVKLRGSKAVSSESDSKSGSGTSGSAVSNRVILNRAG
jgi:hypothetical protein